MHDRVERLLQAGSWIAASSVVLVVAGLVGYVVNRASATLGPSLLFGGTPWQEALAGATPVFDGIWPALAGTLVLVALASALAVPIGIAAGIYLSEYADVRVERWLSLAIDILAGIPSIVMGLFGLSMILLLRRTLAPDAKTGLLLVAACVALLVLPYMIRATQNALRGLPGNLRLLGPSMGLTPVRALTGILLPASSRGILSGVILSVGRAAEDTAVIMLTGAVATAGGRWPHGLFSKFEALPFHIFVVAAEHNTSSELDQGFGAALVLLTFTASLFVGAFVLQRSLAKRWTR